MGFFPKRGVKEQLLLQGMRVRSVCQLMFPCRGQIVVNLTLRILFAVINEIVVAVVHPVSDDPFEGLVALDRARAYDFTVCFFV